MSVIEKVSVLSFLNNFTCTILSKTIKSCKIHETYIYSSRKSFIPFSKYQAVITLKLYSNFEKNVTALRLFHVVRTVTYDT